MHLTNTYLRQLKYTVGCMDLQPDALCSYSKFYPNLGKGSMIFSCKLCDNPAA